MWKLWKLWIIFTLPIMLPVKDPVLFAIADRVPYFLCQCANPHPFKAPGLSKKVDSVDNSQAQKLFAHFYDISGTHGYQQITVLTIL